jgi:autotransporter-associated beta strand protein
LEIFSRLLVEAHPLHFITTMKTNRSNNKPILPLALAFVLGATTAHGAVPVTITNPSFELPAVATDGGFLASATGWTNFNSAVQIGVLNPAVADFTLQAPDGINVGWVFGGVVDAGFAQVLSSTLQADATYSLSVKVGNSLTYAYDGYRVQLLAGGTVLNEDNNTLSPASDTFVTSTVNYVYNAGLHAGLVGQPLEIRLLGKGLSGGSDGETEFDDVQLTVTLGSPLAIAGGPYNVAYTGSLSLNGGASLPSDGQMLTTYEWDLNNDGNYDEMITGETPAPITYATLQSTYGMVVGANTIRLRVTDDSSPTPKTNVSTGTVNLAVGPPANDNFASAIDLTGVGVGQTGDVTTGTQSGTDSISASLEAGEPSPGATNTNSVWFKWTSPGDGEFTYGTLGSTNAGATEWDSVIGIYTGASLNALTPLGTTPKDTVLAETMTVTVTPGTTYYIQLTGYQGEGAANILLSWTYVATVYQAEILTYGPGGVISPVVDNAATIAWTVPFGSDLSTLAPTFTLFVGATATLDGNPAVSGATVDFSGGSKIYVVTSQGGAFVNTYTVTATPAPPPTDGTWITDGNGNWSDPANWDLGTVADGPGKTAFFTKNITTATRVVTLDSARTIGNITFTDSTTPSNDLTISGANILTLDVTTGTPEINVTQTGNRQLTISSVISGSDGLNKAGPGILNLTGANIYTGTTSVTDGLLNFASANLDGFGGGAGSRDISVTANKIVQRTHSALNAAFMKRLVETSDEFAVCSTASGASDVGTGNTLDFSSSANGANLPNAFFGSFATNGGQCRYNGTIIPASDNYRLGFPGTNGALAMIQPLVDIGDTPRGLIVGGATPVLVADNTFTGNTVLRAGRLFLGRQLALQNSALNVGNGAGDGITGQICFLASNGGGATQGQLTDAPTLGGLIGARNLASIYNSANQNNTTRLAIANVLGLTLDVDDGKTHTYAGNARLSTGMFLTKTGLGTQVLSGGNDYSGGTTVNAGTLTIDGSLADATMAISGGTVDGSGTLTFKVNGATIDQITMTGGILDITELNIAFSESGDGLNQATYVLVDRSAGGSIMGDEFDSVTGADGYTVDYAFEGNKIALVQSAGQTYATWSGGAPADGDANGDGVQNAVAYALNAANVNENAIGLLPTLDNTSDPTYFLFSYNRSDAAEADSTTAISVQYGNDLVGWTTAVDDNDNVEIEVIDGTPTDAVVVKLKRSTLGIGGKLFARLNVVVTP